MFRGAGHLLESIFFVQLLRAHQIANFGGDTFWLMLAKSFGRNRREQQDDLAADAGALCKRPAHFRDSPAQELLVNLGEFARDHHMLPGTEDSFHIGKRSEDAVRSFVENLCADAAVKLCATPRVQSAAGLPSPEEIHGR